jgi:predicted transposase/invertase (TIGR01784 family)
MMNNLNEEKESLGKTDVDKYEVNNPHDSVVQKFLQEIKTVKSFFREYLPKDIVSLLNLDSLEFMKEKFVDEVLAKFYSDFLYKVNLSGGLEGFIYLLLEHKSSPYRFSGLQALKYMVRIWDEYLLNNKDAKYLPPVIPVVLYHGGSKWRIDTRFTGLFKVPQALKEFIPDFRYRLLDISHIPDKEINGEAVLKILLLSLKYIFKQGLKDKLPEILKLFQEVENKNSVFDYVIVLLTYFGSSAVHLTEEDIEKSVSEFFEQGGKIMATIAEKWIKKGKEEGKEEGKWEMIMNLLREGLPIDIIAKTSGFSPDQIKQYKEKLQTRQANLAT